MATNYRANPVDVRNFTQSAETKNVQDIRDYSEFLPHINRTESIQRFFGSTVNQLLSSGTTQSIDAYWGRIAGRNYNPETELYNEERDATRLNYQFQPGVVSKTGDTINSTTSYVNWIKRLEGLGADTSNHDRLFNERGYTLDLPINIDMFTNYENYHWLDKSIPLCVLEATITDPIDIDSITSLAHYTTPPLINYREVEFLNGMRVQFVGDYVSSTSGDYFPTVIYYVENVGGEGGIKLVPTTNIYGDNIFPSTMPYQQEDSEGWDSVSWDTTAWDAIIYDDAENCAYGEITERSQNTSYIVMERWAQDLNPWARSNKWFSVHAIRNACEYNQLDDSWFINTATRADRPIIEFQANMELYNTCKTYSGTVDYVFNSAQATDANSCQDQYQIDENNALANGDIVLVAELGEYVDEEVDFNADYDQNDYSATSETEGAYSPAFGKAFALGVQTSYANRVYVVCGVGDAIKFLPYHTVEDDEFLLVRKGDSKGLIYGFKDNVWTLRQNKVNKGQAPLFKLFNETRRDLEDFPENDFVGDPIFSYRINSNGVYDTELGLRPTYTNNGAFSNFRFDFTLSNIRYNKEITIENSEEIRGMYFWRDWVKDDYLNGWSNIRGGQRVPLVQTQVCDGETMPIFELGTTDVEHVREYSIVLENDAYRLFSDSYIDRLPIGYTNPELIWKFDTTYTFNDFVSDNESKISVTDPYGRLHPAITNNRIDENTLEVTISSSYPYTTALYIPADKVRPYSSADIATPDLMDASADNIDITADITPDLSENFTADNVDLTADGGYLTSDTTIGKTNAQGEIHLSNYNQARVFVYKNGQSLRQDDDYVITGTQLEITIDCIEDDVFELYYVANTDLENAVYDVAPTHFYNPENDPFETASYSDLVNHFNRQLMALPGFVGDIQGLNNYHEILRLHTYDGLIRQQVFGSKNLPYLMDQETFNPIRSLKTVARDYSDFKRAFRGKIYQLWNSGSWMSVRDLVDEALTEIHIGKNEDFKYAYSDMAYYTPAKEQTYEIASDIVRFTLPDVVNTYNDRQNHIQVWLLDYNADFDKQIDRPLKKNVDYFIDGNELVLTEFADRTAGDAELRIRWYDYRQLSHIPYSAVKLGFFSPTQVEIVDNVLIGHDGSHYEMTGTNVLDIYGPNFDVIGAALYDLELRIYDNLIKDHFAGATMPADMRTLYPNPVGSFAYDVADMNSRLDDWYNRWAIRNKVEGFFHDYQAADEFSWNYSSVGPGLGSWRSLYTYTFGTDRPHTHPWEMLGHFVKPSWWDDHYSWTAGSKRSALLKALTYGITGNGLTDNHRDINYARSSYDWYANTLVSDDGNATLYGPATAGVISGLTSFDAAKEFHFGDWSETEDKWRKSSEYLFALAEVYLQLKPYRVFETFWSLNRWTTNYISKHEQMVDPDTRFRTHIQELHKQQLTEGVIAGIKVLDGGTGYADLVFDFKQDVYPQRTAVATAFTDGDTVTGIAVDQPGRGFIKTPAVDLYHTEYADGLEIEYLIDRNYVVTSLGFNSLAAESFTVDQTYSNDLQEALENLDITYMVHVGGFTDKRIMDLHVDGDFNSGLIKIPENSYNILIDRGAPNQIAYYSGVRIEKVETGAGFRVYGYNLDSEYFVFNRPSTAGTHYGVDIDNITVNKYKNWHPELYRYPYGERIHRRQDLYDFLRGLGNYYESIGFSVMDRWEEEAIAAILWALDDTDTEPFYVNGIDETLTYNQGSSGVVQTIDVNYDGFPNIIGNDYKAIRRTAMAVLRNEETTEISMKDGSDQIYGLGVRVVEFEHIITLDNVTTFNDPIFRPELGLGQNRIRLIGERTRNWTGRIEAPGYLIQDTGLVLNIESSVRELEKDWISAESKALERLTRQTIGFNVGYAKPTYMSNTFIGDKSAYKFEKGRRKYAGTASAIKAMSRNKNIFGKEFDHEIYEDWMVRMGHYGDLSEVEPLQFAIDPNLIKSDPQQFRFSSSYKADKLDDLIIDYYEGSQHAISGNYENPFEIYDVLRLDNTSIHDLEQYQNFTRDAGLPLTDEIDYYLGSIDDIGDIYDPTNEYATIPNWSTSADYVRDDTVRLYGDVYQLNIDSTERQYSEEEITIRGTQVYPIVTNGSTFIANDITVTFEKTQTTTIYDQIALVGSVAGPSVPSGTNLIIDSISIAFSKTDTVTTYNDIILTGDVINPTIQNSASRTFTIGYATNDTDPLTEYTIDFNELSDVMTMIDITENAFIAAGMSTPATDATSRISILNALQTAYVAAEGAAAWSTLINNYHVLSVTPKKFFNPEYIGNLIAANPGAAWETEARSLIQFDLDLMNEVGSTHTETVTTIVDGRANFNDEVAFDDSLESTNSLFSNLITPNDSFVNYKDLAKFMETSPASTIDDSTQITVTNPQNYVEDSLYDVANKIVAELSSQGAPSNIVVAPVGNYLRVSMTDTGDGYRLGVSTDADLGFASSANDVEAVVVTTTDLVDLDLTDVINAINAQVITGITATASGTQLLISSTNTEMTIGSGSANTSLGVFAGSYTATPTDVEVPVDLTISDVVTQINEAGIADLTASQIEGALILDFVGTTLIIEDGSANSVLGISEAEYNTADSESSEGISNTFNASEWTAIADPVDFNIWTIDNIGSNPSATNTVTNRYDVYQTIDLKLGITEACAGAFTGDDAMITVDDLHHLSAGDYVLIVNTSTVPSINGIHRVTHLNDEYTFFIDYYIDEKGYSGKVFPLRSVRFPTTTDALLALEDEAYVQIGDRGLRDGTFIYVDNMVVDGVEQGHGAVYTVQRDGNNVGLILEREEVGKTNNSIIKNGVLYSHATGETVNRYEVYDPLKGIIPGVAEKEIDIRTQTDFAYYTDSTDADYEIRESNSWGQRNVGTVWWDLSNAIYLNYDQGGDEYRQEHWGELFPTASIDIYEWTKSPVTPDEYASSVQAGTIIDGIELTGIPYSITDQYGEEQYYWAQEVEFNRNTNQNETYFYFWVKNKTTTPNLERQYTVLQLTDIIADPKNHDVNWIAATGENKLLVSNLRNTTGYDDLVMIVNFDADPACYHQEFMLLSEGDPETFIPEWLHISLRDSLAGFTQDATIYNFTYYDDYTTYVPGDIVYSGNGNFYRNHTTIVGENPAADVEHDWWTRVEHVAVNPSGDYTTGDTVSISEAKRIPDLKLHPVVRYGIDTRPHQVWFKNQEAAQQAIIEKINAQFAVINLVDSNIPWRAEFEKSFFVGDLEYDVTEYWDYVDWNMDGYVYQKGRTNYAVRNFAQRDELSPNEGETVFVANSTDSDGRNRFQVYRYEDGDWTLIYKEKATIAFNELLWNTEASLGGWDTGRWDTDTWDKSTEAVMNNIMDSLYNFLWINEYSKLYTDLWFHAAKYVLAEQGEVDWLIKSSYFNITVSDSLEKQFNKYFAENSEEFFDFVDVVKPFRSKIRESSIRKTVREDVDLPELSTVEIRVQTNPLMLNADSEDEQQGRRVIEPLTRAFRLNVNSDGQHYSSQILDRNKVLLGMDIGPEDTIIPYLNIVGDLPHNTGAFWINGERIEYTGKIVAGLQDGVIGSGFTNGYDLGYAGITLLTGCVRGTQGTLARGHAYADIIEDETTHELIEFQDLTEYDSDMMLAWTQPTEIPFLLSDTNAVGTDETAPTADLDPNDTFTGMSNIVYPGLLDDINPDPNSIKIRGTTTLNVVDVTQSNPCVVTVADAPFLASTTLTTADDDEQLISETLLPEHVGLLQTGMVVALQGIGGMTEVDDESFRITMIDDSYQFELNGIDSTSFTDYTYFGTVNLGDRFGTIEPAGSVLYAQWLARKSDANAIACFQKELQNFIEIFWTQNWPWLSADFTIIFAANTFYLADGAKIHRLIRERQCRLAKLLEETYCEEYKYVVPYSVDTIDSTADAVDTSVDGGLLSQSDTDDYCANIDNFITADETITIDSMLITADGKDVCSRVETEDPVGPPIPVTPPSVPEECVEEALVTDEYDISVDSLYVTADGLKACTFDDCVEEELDASEYDQTVDGLDTTADGLKSCD